MNSKIKLELFGSLGIESAEVVELNEATNVEEVDLPEEATPESESSVAEALDDVEVEQEVEGIETQGEDLEDATEGLEELDVAVEAYRATGANLTPIEAAALNLTIRQTVSKFVKDTGDLVPAAESFREDPSEQTRLAHEGLKDAAKSFGDGVVAGAKKAWERLKEIIGDIINRFRGIVGRADRVIVAAKGIQGSISGTVELSKDKISVGGEASGQVLKDGLGRFKASLDRLKTTKKAEETIKIVQELNSGEGSEIKFKDLMLAYDKFQDVTFRAVFGDVTEKDGNLVGKGFPGEWVPMLVKSKDVNREFSYNSLEKTKPAEKGGKVGVEALQPKEIIELAGLVKVVQGSLADYKGFLKRQETVLTHMGSIGPTIGKQMEDAKEGRKELGVSALEATRSLYSAVRREMTFYAKIVSAANQTSGNILELCEKSVKLAGKGGEEGKTEAPKEEGATSGEPAGNLPAPKEGE